jgi:uncharacterized Zn-binding protein involved in type VI secretion
MGRAWIVLGDKTSHGGTVISASGFTYTGGVSVARKGDMASCPRDGHGTCPIISGDYTVIIDGQPVAREGDSTACGAILIASQRFTTVGVEPRNSKGSAPQEASFEAFFSPYEPPAESAGVKFDEKYQFIDEVSGKPLTHRDYVIVRENGREEHGTTDSNGHTHQLTLSSKLESIEIYI